MSKLYSTPETTVILNVKGNCKIKQKLKRKGRREQANKEKKIQVTKEEVCSGNMIAKGGTK